MALSLNSVTPTGHINNIIYWCAGIFNIRGLTFRHKLNKKSVGECLIARLGKSSCLNVRPDPGYKSGIKKSQLVHPLPPERP
jgi:hypothetical protein